MGLSGDAKRAYQRAWLQERRDAWFLGKTCVICGSDEKLEADHIDPTTKRWHTSSIWGRKASDREEELAKCQVLCCECHIVKSALEKMLFKHNRYKYNKGCRCTACKKDHNLRMREQRVKRQ